MKEHLTDEQVIIFLEEGIIDPEAQKHLEQCELCRRKEAEYTEVISGMQGSTEMATPDQIAINFSMALEEEKAKLNPSTFFSYWQIAAAVALLIVGFGVGKLSAPDHSDEVVALQAQVDLLKEMSMVNALQTHSASERIQAVNLIEEEQPRASDKLIRTLVNTLNSDESPNVRYAAAQALSRFMDQESVRLALASSLELQTDALIQIALISMLVEAQEKTAIRPIKKLMEAENNSPEVKKQARLALEILS